MTISMDEDLARAIEARVESGGYADSADLINRMLRARLLNESTFYWNDESAQEASND